MLSMDEIYLIKELARQGLSARQIAEMFCDNKISVTSDTRNPATPPRGREAAAL